MPVNVATIRKQVNRFMPITGWLRGYDRSYLRSDLISGLTVWGVVVPVAMAYAQMAGVSAQAGLYTAMAAIFAYAIFGTSRQLKVTASSTMAVMSAATVSALAVTDPGGYLALTSALALCVGTLLLLAGVARLGFISDFLSKSVVTGFIFGLALTIAIGQAPKLFGVPSTSGDFFEQLAGLIANLGTTNLYTLAVGAGSLAVIYGMRWRYPRIPAALAALVFGILAVTIFNLSRYGVSIVGAIPTGLPKPALPRVPLASVTYLFTGAVGIVFLAVGESLGAARAFAARHHYEINPDQELIALGAANLATGLFQGFTVDASLSSTAAADANGAKTQLSSLVSAALILITVIFLAPLFHNLPNATLGAIVVVAVIGLMDVAEMRRYLEANRSDFLLALVALMGVLLTDVLTGLLIAVFLSLLMILYRASRPYVAVLGQAPGHVAAYTDISRHPENRTVPGLLIVRIDAALYFLNANVMRTQVLNLIAAAQPPPRAVLLDLGATADLDIASLDMLQTLVAELDQRGIDVLLAQVRGGVRDRLRGSGLMAEIGAKRIYLSVAAAVYDFEQRAVDRSTLKVEGAESNVQPSL